MASYAYDMETMRESYTLKALIHIYFDEYQDAIECFKKVRSIADEEESIEYKMITYENLGKCYSQMKENVKALKCFKKYLELSWRLNIPEAELKAYEYIGYQYYYMGKLEKAKYYNDRSMRGKLENKDSKIRIIYERQNKERSEKLKGDKITFKKIKDILDGFKNIKNKLLKSVQTRILSNACGIGTLNKPADFYRNGLTFKEKQLNLQGGSPISNISLSDLPSPRLVIENDKFKNAMLLPHYCGNDEIVLSKKQQYILQVAKFQNKTGKKSDEKGRGGSQKKEEFNQDLGAEIMLINKEKFKDNTVLDKFKRVRQESKIIRKGVDMKEIIRKSKFQRQKQMAAITINHLSPNRYLRHFKEKEELRTIETQKQFIKFENEIKDSIIKAEHETVHVSQLNQGQVQHLITEFGNQKQNKSGRRISEARQNDAVSIKLMAILKHGQHDKIQKYGVAVNQSLQQRMREEEL